MFTDTKNLANLCVNNTNASMKLTNLQQQQQQQLQQSDKFKLRKVWKPILRLMSIKSATAGKNNRSIPNNVNLNNAHITHNTPKDLLFSSAEVHSDLEEQFAQLTVKLPEVCQTEEDMETKNEMSSSSKEPLEFISRVSVDKTPLNTCNNCVHGRNCQHSQYHQQTATQSSSPLLLHEGDLNFINAEDGYFVWSDTFAEMDEQLLRQWYWQNSWQFAENATMC
ncbi:enhancer of split M2 protein [Stomoxys calcitrans]|uniref:enhancer of split M2 protein n=1 Tax=Stomoxys calcitrans TaxID=35570 RepID=UPI0027E22ADB|nr:enhancer of split M2 protein [Stomoxys calcitrans]